MASKLGLSGRMARPFVVVHSGKMTTHAPGLRRSRDEILVSFADGDGLPRGECSARCMACQRVTCSTWRVFGYEAVKMGSKIAARYTGSIGDAKEAAMTDPACGRRDLCCFARDLKHCQTIH